MKSVNHLICTRCNVNMHIKLLQERSSRLSWTGLRPPFRKHGRNQTNRKLLLARPHSVNLVIVLASSVTVQSNNTIAYAIVGLFVDG
jgi:hypothetical protein